MKKMTVTELSEAFGVTRQAMNNRIKKLSDEYLAKNDRGVTVVNEDGIKRLEKHYGKVILEDRTDKNQEAEKNSVNIDFDKIITQLIEDKNTEISRLSDQIAMKDHQIAEKDKQLDQQQQLTAKALTEREQSLLELEQEKSKGFFAKLCRK